MKVSALFVEGVQHVANHLNGARGEQKRAICDRMEAGLEVAQRPPDFARGVTAAIQAARQDAASD